MLWNGPTFIAAGVGFLPAKMGNLFTTHRIYSQGNEWRLVKSAKLGHSQVAADIGRPERQLQELLR